MASGTSKSRSLSGLDLLLSYLEGFLANRAVVPKELPKLKNLTKHKGKSSLKSPSWVPCWFSGV